MDTAQFDSGVRRVQSSFSKFTQGAMQLNQTFQLVAGTARAVVAPFMHIAKVGGDFQESMIKVKAVSRASSEEFEKLTEVAKRMGETTMWSASESAKALQFLSMAGFKATESVEALPGVLELATVGAVELGRAADVSSNILSTFGLQATQLGRVNDVLVNTFTRTNTDLDMMAESFKYAGSGAHALGYSIEETAAMIGILGNSGIQGSMAGTQLSMAFTEAGKVFKKAGMNGDGKNLIDALKLIKKEGWGATEIMEIFGQRSSRAVLTLVERLPELDALTKAIREGGGAARDTAQEMEKGLNKAFKELGSVIEAVEIEAFEKKAGKVEARVRSISESIRENKTELATLIDDVGSVLLFAGEFVASAVNRAWDINNFIMLMPDHLAKVNSLSADALDIYLDMSNSWASQVDALKAALKYDKERLELAKEASRIFKDNAKLQHNFRVMDSAQANAPTPDPKDKLAGVTGFAADLRKLKAQLEAVNMKEHEAAIHLVKNKYEELALAINEGAGANAKQREELEKLQAAEIAVINAKKKRQTIEDAAKEAAKAAEAAAAKAKAAQEQLNTERANALDSLAGMTRETAREASTWKLTQQHASDYAISLAEIKGEYDELILQYKHLGPEVLNQIELWKKQKEALAAAKNAQKEYNDTFKGGVEHGMNDARDTVRSAGEVMQKGWADTTQSMANSFSSFFSDVVRGEAKSVGQYLLDFFGSVMDSIMSMFAQNIAGSFMGSVGGGGSFLSFLGLHAGGGVGSASNTMHLNRPDFNPAAFAFAPKFHDGLAGDEFPAILQRGETVIPKGYALGQSQGQPKNVTVKIVNESGQEMNVTKSRATQDDFGQMVVETWIDAHYNNKHGLRTYMGG
jgi:TP901 family phage tail tape measure protein